MSGTDGKAEPRGIVLVAVVIVIAVLSAVAVDFMYSTRVSYEISANGARDVRARHMAKSGIRVLQSVMNSATLEDIPPGGGSLYRVESRNGEEGWELSIPSIAVGEGTLSVRIRDERSKVNLNALVDQKSNRVDFQVRTQLLELFRLLGVAEEKSELFVASLVNWLDREMRNLENDQDPDGASAAHYAGLEEPYYIKDGTLDSLEEIRMIEGMDEEFFLAVGDYLTVYPGDKKVSFSTASKLVMMATLKASRVSVRERRNMPKEIRDGVLERMAEAVIERRQKDRVVSLEDAKGILAQEDSGSNVGPGLSGMFLKTGESDFFSATSVGVVGESRPVTRRVEAVVGKGGEEGGSPAAVISWKER